MPRIPLLNSPEQLSPAQRRVYDAVVSGPRGKLQGPLMAALHNPDLADKWQQLGAILRYHTSLPLQLSEVAILVTARAWTCQLEWFLHEGYARAAGVETDVIEAIKVGRRPDGADADTLGVVDFCHELQTRRKVSDATYARVLARWGAKGAVELTALTGYYAMVAMTLNAHEFPLPDGAAPPLAPLAI